MLGLDNIEVGSMEKTLSNATNKLASLREGFSSRLTAENNIYMIDPYERPYDGITWIDGTQYSKTEIHQIASGYRDIKMMQSGVYMSSASIYDTLSDIFHGTELSDGTHALGLDELYHHKINPQYAYSNLKQQAGFAAEIISTAKENLEAKAKGKEVTTYRADDRPDLFPKNDQYVDKIRVDNNTGEILERIQTKFVGKNPNECLTNLLSEDYDKYFNDGKVDKVEIPKEFYSDVKKMLADEISELEKELQHTVDNSDPDVSENIQKRLDRCKKTDAMLEQSNTTSEEAIFARKHPRSYVSKIWAKEAIKDSHKVGVESGMIAAGLTATISTVDNVQKYMNGEITAQEAALDIAKDTGAAGALGYGTAFVSTTVSTVMSASSHELIKSVAASGAPGVVISFGIDTYDSVIEYAKGNIDASELAYDLGEGAVHIAGAAAGAEIASNVGMAIGGAVGSVVPGAGTVAGMAVGKVAGYGIGMVGGMVGCAIASEAYATAVEFGAENAGVLAEKAKVAAQGTIELAKVHAPEKVADIRNAVNEYASKFNLPFSV